ncbi:hypothetical protein WCE41_05340 [Luteimonas sp. MJ246]|uniref:hypothetical protein n=1 Tax=Luteimonas sp. MJ174 TaxID=3129237 RepID=UPI0031B9B58A
MATLAAAGWPAQVHAQTVQKCIDTTGHVTLTSGECADGERLAGMYDAVPEPATAAAAGKAESRRGQAGASSRSGATARGAAGSARPARAKARGKLSPDRCQAARDRREQTLRRVGLKRTFDLLRKLDDEVWAACTRRGG